MLPQRQALCQYCISRNSEPSLKSCLCPAPTNGSSKFPLQQELDLSESKVTPDGHV
jgi:hypothetical protein